MDLTKVRVGMTEKIPPPVVLIHAPNDPESKLLTTDSMMVVKGPIGSGKSRLICNLVKGLFTGDDDIGLHYTVLPRDAKILYVNTELSRGYLQNRMKNLARVCNMSEDDFEDMFIGIDLLPIPLLERKDYLTELVVVFKPTVVIIDQIGDFVVDINVHAEATLFMERLTTIMAKHALAVICVIHQNEERGSASKARGSLGSELEQKIFSGLSITKPIKGIHSIQSTKIRDGKGIDKLNVVYNQATDYFIKTDAVPVTTQVAVKKFKINPSHYNHLLPCTVGTLAAEIASKEDKSSRSAETYISELVKAGIWEKTDSGFGTTIVSLAVPGQYGPIN